MTIRDIQAMKDRNEIIPMLTAYDYTSARLVEQAGVPLILVGDSLGMVVLGYTSTVPVTLEEMIHHTRAVVRGTSHALIVGDMPFMTYQISPEQAMRSAGRLLQESGCQAVKLEGGQTMAETTRRLVEAGIPVMGHIGLTPQSVNQLGGFRVQGKTTQAAHRLIDDALAIEDAGAFSIVLEAIPGRLAGMITTRLRIPTIGIGAGAGCSGQVQVLHDMLGLFEDFVPKHAKQYATLATEIRRAVGQYVQEVQESAFPDKAHTFHLSKETPEGVDGITQRAA